MIRRANEADVPGIVRVVNEAFEVEREFRKGDRTSAAEIGALLARDVFLVTEQDDTAEILSPQFYTRSDDPQKYRFAPPADGTYYLLVTSRDAFTQFGPRFIYTVRITPDEFDSRFTEIPRDRDVILYCT